MRKYYFIPAIVLLLFAVISSCHTPKASTYTSISKAEHTTAGLQKAAAIKSISADAFTPYVFSDGGTIQLPYRLLSPANIYAGTKYPLVVVFHSSGGVGSDNMAQVGLLAKLWAVDGIRNQYPAYVLAPQFAQRSSNYVLHPQKQVLTSQLQPCLAGALQLIDSLIQVLPIDRDRIYVTGFSMGASTVVNAISMRPHFFAAGIAFSGIPDLNKEKELQYTPLWMIHGNADTENVFTSDALFYKEMKAAGAKNIRFWEMDKMAHEIPVEIYTTNAIPEWLFGRKRRRGN